MRSLFTLIILIVLGYCATTVPIGAPHKLADPGWPWSTHESRLTFAGHIRAIWHTEEMQDLKNGIEEQAGPAAKEIKKTVHDATDDHDSSSQGNR